ncbi:aspartyl-phosphate phosphatase Spo0E family protein [Sporosarcina sp. FSL K6-3457]|uniref:aspartyl-phosphate phosphatase Spo0E family protein n=1 Tax=Sporosarcina sp. FSL K6-3457 TaxID=2978204 RepID=UPI0030F4E555
MERSLEEEIELMREAMMDAADKDGLTADETIEFSRKLDSLINQFDKRRDFY